MGNFRIEIDAVGGHGCSREVKDDEIVKVCRHPSCPDCMARAFVRELKDRGCFNLTPSSATFTHWPGEPTQVVDNLLTGRRKGSF